MKISCNPPMNHLHQPMNNYLYPPMNNYYHHPQVNNHIYPPVNIYYLHPPMNNYLHPPVNNHLHPPALSHVPVGPAVIARSAVLAGSCAKTPVIQVMLVQTRTHTTQSKQTSLISPTWKVPRKIYHNCGKIVAVSNSTQTQKDPHITFLIAI